MCALPNMGGLIGNGSLGSMARSGMFGLAGKLVAGSKKPKRPEEVLYGAPR